MDNHNIPKNITTNFNSSQIKNNFQRKCSIYHEYKALTSVKETFLFENYGGKNGLWLLKKSGIVCFY